MTIAGRSNKIDHTGDEDINPRNNIWVTEFNTEAAIDFHEKVFEKLAQDSKNPLVIYINSPGGHVAALISMMDTMDCARSQASKDFYFITIVYGEACSCAAYLLAHGDLRVATPKSTIMFHQVSGGALGHVKDMEIEIDFTKKLNTQLMEIFLADTGFKGGVEQFKKFIERDRYLNPEQAKELGIIDEIGFITQNFRMSVETEIKAPGNDIKKAKTLRRSPLIEQRKKRGRK